MGIKGLAKLIEAVAEDAIIEKKISELEGHTVSVDASLIINQFVKAIRTSGSDLTNSEGFATSHLSAIFYRSLGYLQNGIVPIFVFDGKAPDTKNHETKKRHDIRECAVKKLETLDEDDKSYGTTYAMAYQLTKEHVEQALVLLDLMGVPYIMAPGEADVVCSWLACRRDDNGSRYAYGVSSEDSDMLAFGSPYLLRGMSGISNSNKVIKITSLKKTLECMKIDMDQFIDMCVMLGTDGCEKIKGYGLNKTLLLIQKKKTLEQSIKYVNGDAKHSKNDKRMLAMRDYFKNAVSELDEDNSFVISDDQIKLRKFQYDELMDFMCHKNGFEVSRMINGVNRLDQYYQKMNVTRGNTKKVYKLSKSRRNIYSPKMLELGFSSDEDEEPIRTKKTARNKYSK